MALIATGRNDLDIHTRRSGSGYVPEQIGSWVATDARDLPWNTIGEALEHSSGNGRKVDHVMTAAEALTATGLDRIQIEKIPVLDGQTKRAIPRMFATGYVDPDTGERLYFSAVSDKYQVVQPTEALGSFDAVVGAIDGSHYTSVWAMREKAMMGLTIELPEEVVVDPNGANDRLAVHLLGVNSFDGSTGLSGSVITTRWWCMNQFSPRIPNTKRSFCLRHTKNVRERAADVGHLIGVSREYLAALDRVANGLYAKAMTERQFERFLQKFDPWTMPNNASNIVAERVNARREEAIKAWRASHNANITGTRWGALQVVGEFAEWGRTVKGSHRTGTTPERQRAIGTLVHPTVSGLVTDATRVLMAA